MYLPGQRNSMATLVAAKADCGCPPADGSWCELPGPTDQKGQNAVTSPKALSWHPIDRPSMPAVAELARVCLATDGGQPFAASPDFLRRCYLDSTEAMAGYAGGELVCATSLRRPPATLPGASGAAVTTGMVHPAWRRRGIGGHAFDWARSKAGRDELRAENDTLSDGAHALYLSRGLTQILAEDVMQLPATTQPPPANPPRQLALSTWGQADPTRFYAVYHAAFRQRPGFPGWPQEGWIEWITDDEDFRSEWALLATLDGTDVAFIAGAATGWITQLGVIPAARGQDIGAGLLTEVISRMRAAGETVITLNVNVNNPHAAALYRRIGFTRTGRRGKYQARPEPLTPGPVTQAPSQ